MPLSNPLTEEPPIWQKKEGYRMIRVSIDDEDITLSFPYNARLVAGIKAISYRTWDPLNKLWRIPIQLIDQVIVILDNENVEYTPEAEKIFNQHKNTVYLTNTDDFKKINIESTNHKALQHITTRYQLQVPIEEYHQLKEWIENGGYTIRIGEQLADRIVMIPTDEIKNINPLKYPLRPYQKVGAAFLANAKKALLADDIGSGKTVTSLAGTILLKERGLVNRSLIVTIASAKHQWVGEIEKFTDEKAVLIRSGISKKKREELYKNTAFFTVINYELIRHDIKTIMKEQYDQIILDEIQRIKNYRTKTYKSIKRLKPPVRWGLTGSPIENNLEELYVIMSYINPRILGERWKFQGRYIIYKEVKIYTPTPRIFHKVDGYKNLDELREILKPVVYRNKKEDVLPHLPPVITLDYYAPLLTNQRRLYREIEAQITTYLSRPEADLKSAFTRLTYLREVSDSTALVSDEINESGKLIELTNIIEDLDIGHNIIIFTQYSKMGEIIHNTLKSRYKERSIHYIYGGTPPRRREEIKYSFNNTPESILVSTDCLREAVNLQSADIVINFDLPWTHTRLLQRIGRAHREGQKRTVKVINILTEDTVEKKVTDAIMKKKNLSETVLDTEEYNTGGLDIETLREIFDVSLRRDGNGTPGILE